MLQPIELAQKNVLQQYAEFLMARANDANYTKLDISLVPKNAHDLKVLLEEFLKEANLHSEIRQPLTKEINGFVVRAPETALPPKCKYYVARPDLPKKYLQTTNCQEIADQHHLKMGLVFLSQDDAVAYANAMCGIDPEK
jgi:hypothetical protein